jgi:hypothetical protein
MSFLWPFNLSNSGSKRSNENRNSNEGSHTNNPADEDHLERLVPDSEKSSISISIDKAGKVLSTLESMEPEESSPISKSSTTKKSSKKSDSKSVALAEMNPSRSLRSSVGRRDSFEESSTSNQKATDQFLFRGKPVEELDLQRLRLCMNELNAKFGKHDTRAILVEKLKQTMLSGGIIDKKNMYTIVPAISIIDSKTPSKDSFLNSSRSLRSVDKKRSRIQEKLDDDVYLYDMTGSFTDRTAKSSHTSTRKSNRGKSLEDRQSPPVRKKKAAVVHQYPEIRDSKTSKAAKTSLADDSDTARSASTRVTRRSSHTLEENAANPSTTKTKGRQSIEKAEEVKLVSTRKSRAGTPKASKVSSTDDDANEDEDEVQEEPSISNAGPASTKKTPIESADRVNRPRSESESSSPLRSLARYSLVPFAKGHTPFGSEERLNTLKSLSPYFESASSQLSKLSRPSTGSASRLSFGRGELATYGTEASDSIAGTEQRKASELSGLNSLTSYGTESDHTKVQEVEESSPIDEDAAVNTNANQPSEQVADEAEAEVEPNEDFDDEVGEEYQDPEAFDEESAHEEECEEEEVDENEEDRSESEHDFASLLSHSNTMDYISSAAQSSEQLQPDDGTADDDSQGYVDDGDEVMEEEEEEHDELHQEEEEEADDNMAEENPEYSEGEADGDMNEDDFDYANPPVHEDVDRADYESEEENVGQSHSTTATSSQAVVDLISDDDDDQAMSENDGSSSSTSEAQTAITENRVIGTRSMTAVFGNQPSLASTASTLATTSVTDSPTSTLISSASAIATRVFEKLVKKQKILAVTTGITSHAADMERLSEHEYSLFAKLLEQSKPLSLISEAPSTTSVVETQKKTAVAFTDLGKGTTGQVAADSHLPGDRLGRESLDSTIASPLTDYNAATPGVSDTPAKPLEKVSQWPFRRVSAGATPYRQRIVSFEDTPSAARKHQLSYENRYLALE